MVERARQLRVLVVDDEQLARQRIARMLADQPDAVLAGEAANGEEALRQCEALHPDVVLLDIRMPGMDGLEAARHLLNLDTPPAVVFCTAYEEHAIAAFGVQAVGYLLKPVRRDDLAGVLHKAQRTNRAQLKALAEADGSRRQHISARTHKGIQLIPVDQVRYFQADQKYVALHHGDGEVLIDESLRELEDEFGALFVRIHRSTLVALAFVEGLERVDEGHFQMRLKDREERLPVSRRHLAEVRRLIKSL